MCDRLFPRSGRRCPRPAEFVLLVEMTGEEVELCPDCTNVYERSGAITYAPKQEMRM